LSNPARFQLTTIILTELLFFALTILGNNRTNPE